MLRQVFVIKGDDIIYQRIFANALNRNEVEDLRFKIKSEARKKSEEPIGFFDYYKYRVSYAMELQLNLSFIIITGLMDDYFRLIRPVLYNLKEEFLKIYSESNEQKEIDLSLKESLNSIIDSMHSSISSKISLVGFSGVGKTTIKNLLKEDEIPLQHIPTISGDMTTVQIGKLQFQLFDFAGQEQFKYLWKGFIKGSTAVLVVTDSTPINVEKSRFFINLRNEEAPYAFIAIIGNKQDLDSAMKIENIENILGLKTYPMVANKDENRDKMIHIIADILDINVESSPLLEGTVEKEKVEEIAEPTPEVAKEDEAPLKKVYKNVNLDLKLCNELIRDIKGVKVENILRNHFNMISSTIKALNNNEELAYEDFYKLFQDHSENRFECKNIALKQFLEVQFLLLKKSIDEDEIIATKLKDDLDIVINALICAYFTIANPFKYPIYETLLNKLELDNFDAQTVKEIHAYYLRILNKISK